MLSSFINRMVISPPADPTLDEDIIKNTVEEVIQINVLNATLTPGIAGETREYLRNRGFDVVEVGNFTDRTERSMIIDRVGDVKSAKKIGYAMGIPDSCIVTKLDSNMFLRATIILADDFRSLKPFVK